MSFFIVKLCLLVLVFSLLVGSGISEVCECEPCQEFIFRFVPQYCSMEKKFVLGLNRVSWFQALENCEMEGYNLATITSKNDTENLLRNIKEAGKEDRSFWLSGTDLHNRGGEWAWWTSPETPFEHYTNWYPGAEPDKVNNDEHCIHVWSKGTWNDRRCYDNLYYACEYYTSL